MALWSECIFRNRHVHKFLAVSDTDEYFWVADKSQSLESFLDSKWPEDVASLAFADIFYPEKCQGIALSDPHNSPLNDSHMMSVNKHTMFRDRKSFVRPKGASCGLVHTLWFTEKGFKQLISVPASEAYWKHIRSGNHDCNHLFNDATNDTRLHELLASYDQHKQL